MTVTRLFVGDRVFEVTGEGYEPVGEIREKSSKLKVLSSELCGSNLHLENPEFRTEPVFRPARSADDGSALQRCHTATGGGSGAHSRRSDGRRIARRGGEGSAHDRDTRFDLLLSRRGAVRSERKMMTIVRRTPDGPTAYVKGAPDVLLQHCTHRLAMDGTTVPLTKLIRTVILDANASFAHQAASSTTSARPSIFSCRVMSARCW